MSRPPRAEVRADRYFGFRVTQAEYSALRAWADRQGLSPGDAARLALLGLVAEDGVSSVSYHEIDPPCEPVDTAPARRLISDRPRRAG